jgi:hypothetical protein
VTDTAFIIFLAMVSAFWGYLIYRELRHGQFRRKGEWGWFSRKDHPREFAFSLVLDAGYLIVLVAVIGWILVAKPKL